ncbi:hypothetical protein GCM10018966_077940 [Streptomyces yanii]
MVKGLRLSQAVEVGSVIAGAQVGQALGIRFDPARAATHVGSSFGSAPSPQYGQRGFGDRHVGYGCGHISGTLTLANWLPCHLPVRPLRQKSSRSGGEVDVEFRVVRLRLNAELGVLYSPTA